MFSEIYKMLKNLFQKEINIYIVNSDSKFSKGMEGKNIFKKKNYWFLFKKFLKYWYSEVFHNDKKYIKTFR